MAYSDFDNKKDGVVPNGWEDNKHDGVFAADDDGMTQDVPVDSFGKNNPRPDGGHKAGFAGGIVT